MKQTFLFFVLTASCLLIAAPGQTDLVSLYKAGTIECQPDPAFASGVDWESLFMKPRKEIVAAPDGSIFVSSQDEHNIRRFDPDGSLIKTFGRRGRGPGDLERPGKMSILDGQILVVGDRISNLRISLFDLDGSFRKVLKTEHTPTSPQALSDNKIAYIALLNRPPDKARPVIARYIEKVIIKDVDSGEENAVVEYKTSMNRAKDGKVFIARTRSGQLLVGMSLNPELDIYDLSGKRTGSISLDIDPLKVTAKVRENHQLRYAYIKDGRRHSDKGPIGDFLPYYCDLSVDSEGNILVFLMKDNIKEGPFPLQVYSPEGTLLCRSSLDTGDYEFFPDNRFHKFEYTDRGIFCILHRKGDEMETPRLMRIKIR